MFVFGLTGGIATGKSTVTAMIREAGVPVIDADALAREIVQPGMPALTAIAAAFPGVVANGQLDRAKLGKIVFSNEVARGKLNAITHPRIKELAKKKKDELAAQGVTHAIYDAALLIENRLHEAMQGVILVTCPVEVQVQRVMSRDGLSEDAARARIASQMPTEEKKKYATWLIDNGGALEATRAQVKQVLAEVLRYGSAP
ncbi:MAG: dephospho-CoA kinase [Archangium gephyra]|uniref:Dephospho-CoA kinase n=1 Tax=Archangium gephyra TaxID=48 RepID=A0A2W5VIH6_9BACT|nr:MAG: dephospho-CoA kinase [Archangium gephyra]